MDSILTLAWIGFGLAVGIPVIAIIIGACTQNKSYGSGPMSINTHLPDGEEYKDKVGTPQGDNPSIAEQFDGRITNVFRNPWEGIL
ncbi:MAG: hypothetical protein J6Q48_09790 [Bacteroidaceae bacterium]|nr:hypothetical protein [Bacteroidaceae bacterium]